MVRDEDDTFRKEPEGKWFHFATLMEKDSLRYFIDGREVPESDYRGLWARCTEVWKN